MTHHSKTLLARWLDALLPVIPFDGWTERAAKAAAQKAGLTPGEQALAAPRGLADLVDAFFDTVEQDANQALLASDLSNMGVREKVAHGVRLWLSALAPNKEAARRAGTRGFLPWAIGDALQRTYSVADMVWTGIGDTSTDYNKYSKRGLLASTIPAIFMRWLDEDDDARLEAYIMARLTSAMTLGQTAGKIASPFLDLLKSIRND